AVLFGRLLLVQSLEGAVVALIETPVTTDRDPVEAHLPQGDLGGVGGTQQKRRVENAESVPVLGHQLPRPARLFLPLLGEGDIGPAGEQVLEIPGRLTVPEQHQFHAHDLKPPSALRAPATRRRRSRRGSVPCSGVAPPIGSGNGTPPRPSRPARSPRSAARRTCPAAPPTWRDARSRRRRSPPRPRSGRRR